LPEDRVEATARIWLQQDNDGSFALDAWSKRGYATLA
jgi:hypothetical protein